MASLNQCIFSKKLGRLSSVGPEMLAFGSHRSAKFQLILDCCIPNIKLKHEDSENIKTDDADRVVFNLLQVKQRKFFWGHPVHLRDVSNFLT